MEQLFTQFDPWTWFIIGGVLLVVELIAPSIFFMFLGLAALAVGLVDQVIPMNWQVELALFSALSVVLLIVARPIVMKRVNADSDQPNLNQRNQNFVGKSFKLTDAIVDRKGSLIINDTNWRVRGADAPKNSWVKVVEVDGLELVVEPEGKT